MSTLNIYIDGTWLFRACGGGAALAGKTDKPDSNFSLNFERMNDSLLAHVTDVDPKCDSLGDSYLATSIFTLPDDLEDWPDNHSEISQDQIDRVRRGAHARESFLANAVSAGYKTDAVFRPLLRAYMIQKLADGKFQEKQVDSSVVALLVKNAITKPDDYHVVITGDADVIPAIRVAYPDYTKNVVIATTHPDQLQSNHRQASYSLLDFQFDVPTYFLAQNAKNIIDGEHVYDCAHCAKVFTRLKPIPTRAQPCCFSCHKQRE